MNRTPLFLIASAAAIIVLLFSIPLSAWGAGYLQGYVKNDTAVPIEGADIITDWGASTKSLADGFYLIAHPSGTFTVTASATGYTPQIKPGITLTEASTTFVDFTLSPTALKLESAYPTLGGVGEELDVTLTGQGFDENIRVSMSLNVGNEEAIIGSVVTPGLAVDVAISGNYAIIADWYDIQIADISDPQNPMIVDAVDIGVNRRVTISGNYAYIAGSAGLYILDISTLASTSLLNTVPLSSPAYDVTIADNKAFVGADDLYIVDVSNPAAPSVLGSTGSTELNWVQGVTVAGSKAYIMEYHNGFYVIDISTPSNPVINDHINTPGYGGDVEVQGNYAFVADGWEGIRVIDISDPTNCWVAGQASLPGYAQSIEIVSVRAYVPNDYGGLQIVDISQPTSPQVIGYVDTPGEARGVALDGNTAYVAAENAGLQIVEVSNPQTSNFIGSIETGEFPDRIKIVGNISYVVDKGRRLFIIDISDPVRPNLLSSIARTNINAASVKDGKAYLASYQALYIYDVSNPSSPTHISSTYTPNSNSDVVVADGKAYVASRYTLGIQGLIVIDVDPQSPTYRSIIGQLEISSSDPHGVAVVGNYAYLACKNLGLQVIDISDPTNPQAKGLADTPGWAWGVTVADGKVFVADYDQGLQIIDASNPDAPQIIGSVDTEGTAFRVTVVDNYAYVSDSDNGVQLIDVSDPQTPQIIGSIDTPGNAKDTVVLGNLAYVATGQAGQMVVAPVPIEVVPVAVNSATDISVTLPSPVLSGHYALRVFNAAQSHELYAAVSFTDNLLKLNSKAIIVAGGGPDAPGDIWEETMRSANKAYDALIQQGYDHDSINYLSMEPRNQNQYVDNPSLNHYLSDAVNNWSQDATELLLFFVDHGEPDHFILYANGDYAQKLSVQELDDMLDTLQGIMNGPVTFVYDACQSGTFVSKLRPPAGKQRVVITGASNEPAYFLNQGIESFSYQFWDKLLYKEGNAGHAFSAASDIMKTYQTALLDADGDGVSNEVDDLNLVADLVIRRGSPVLLDTQPVIGSVSVGNQILNGTTFTTISAEGVADADQVWAQIIPADVSPETSGIPITALPSVELTDPDQDGIYVGSYNGFTVEGTYIIIAKAVASHEVYSYVSGSMVIQNIYSTPSYTSVTQMTGTQNIEADSYEIDDTSGQAKVINLNDLDVQTHNFHDLSDIDWVKFYALSGETYKIKVGNVSVICDVIFEVFDSNGTPLPGGFKNDTGAGEDEYLDWTFTQDGIYYVKLSNNKNSFGENVKYDLQIYRPIGPLAGFIEGVVTAAVSGDPIEDAMIKTGQEFSALSLSGSGAYLMVHPPGSFSFTVEAIGFETYSDTVTVIEGGFVSKNITMLPPDSDGDGIPDDIENAGCTDYLDADSDDDGIDDGVEDANQNGSREPDETSPCNADTDGDGIQDSTELGYTLNDVGPDTNTNQFQPDLDPSTITDPLDDDTDNDGLLDGEEDANHNGRFDPGETDPNQSSRSVFTWLLLLLMSD